MSGEEVINIKTSGVDGYSQKMYSSCYCCIIKVSSMNIRGCSCPPTPNLKLGKKIKGKNPFPPSPPDPPCPCLLFSTYTTLWLVSSFRSPLLAGLPPPRLSFAFSECWFRHLEQDLSLGMVDAHCLSGWLVDLWKIQENGSTFFPGVGAVDPFKLLSELPGPIALYPLRIGKRKTYLY